MASPSAESKEIHVLVQQPICKEKSKLQLSIQSYHILCAAIQGKSYVVCDIVPIKPIADSGKYTGLRYSCSTSNTKSDEASKLDFQASAFSWYD